MRDIPVFATENGVGSLVLQEIPYSKTAYIKIQDASQPEAFIKECKDFCAMAGAEHIYATGHSVLETYPLYTAIYRMSRDTQGLPETDALLFPVTEETLERWRELYNQKMKSVPNTAYMTLDKGKQMLQRGEGYFVHRDGKLLGIGMASGDRLDAVAAVVPYAGQDVVLALCHALSGEQIVLDVASENGKAIRLYERLGFVKTAELSKWYCIFPA